MTSGDAEFFVTAARWTLAAAACAGLFPSFAREAVKWWAVGIIGLTAASNLGLI